MSIRWFAGTVLLMCVAARATEPTSVIYDHDPEHLWNRLYQAIAVRTDGGAQTVTAQPPWMNTVTAQSRSGVPSNQVRAGYLEGDRAREP